MKKLKEELKYGKKGITLISLVVTIIVLLILAGVTIATLTGNNGILTRATEAKNKTEKAEDIEKIKMAVLEAQIGENGYQNLSLNNLQKALNTQFGEKTVVSDNGDGIFNINLDDKIYKIDNNQVKELQIDLYINNEGDLKRFRDEVNAGNNYDEKNIILKNNITISEEWTPIGLNDNGFRGNFYGNNKSITLSINSEDDNIGFISINHGNIYSLNIIGNIVGNDFVAGVVAQNYGNIINCSNSANIQSNSTSSNPYTGGIVGKSFEGSILNCYNNGNIVQSHFSIGGIAGGADNTIVKNCYNSGKITASGQVGGVVGRISEATIINCYNSGKITSISNVSGGIVGESIYLTTAIIKNCYNVGNINGNSNTGGICGSINGTTIENCYNLANVIGNGSTGGIVGNGNSTIIKGCYHKGDISGKSEQKPNAFEGGIAGSSSSVDNLTMCKWYSETISYTIGNLNITNDYTVDLEMPDILEVINSDNAFKADKNNINNGYPILNCL